MTELKPCPFCGGEASKRLFYGTRYGVYCDECDARVGGLFGTEAEAVEAWNTRAERTCYPSENLYGFLMCCSECGRSLKDIGGTLFNYCPNCGAKVVEK